MKISVIICAFNEEELIEKSIQSVVDQKFPKSDYEIIVVNDESTDSTRELALKAFSSAARLFPDLHTSLVDIRHGGLSIARNVGVLSAKAEVLAFIDADALAKNDWLHKISAVFDSNPAILLCGGWVELLNVESPVASAIHSELIFKRDSCPSTLMLMGTNMVFRKTFFANDFGFFAPFVSRGDETVLLRHWGIGHEAPAGVPVAEGRMLMDPSIVVFHERPSSYLAWMRERYQNGRFYMLSLKIVSLLRKGPEDTSASRILVVGFLSLFVSVLAFPLRVYRSARIISVISAVKLQAAKLLGGVMEIAGSVWYRSVYRTFELTRGINSIAESGRYITNIQREF